ncbi:zinc finger C2H2-type/integrase DNA-binding domain-containing protein [Artemisia annua]|uniref:Zinc finger C2H2-type/integrase DNA-binding domain-containing protein n=1 Tax=Artemisia annua TaxID=35608 RepID=A0A2U1MRT3_ARTAN|nr:zinc finger C2H2-type/integrase DNA-binding domain-containing protein [Artemisia annua]
MMMKQQKVVLEDNTISKLGGFHAKPVDSFCSEEQDQENGSSFHQHYFEHPPPSQSQPSLKRKRNLPGNPDPDAEVIALSPKTLMATNRFVCEICSKGFQRDQNLQLHRRGHNLPWKLKQRNKDEVVRKKVYVCPEVNCVHHEPSRALGDLTGIKKHFSRKHGEKKWKCDKCSKRYAVQSDWKAHSKTCGTREYKCDCGTLFSRRDSFITHRAFCDALAEESARALTGLADPSGQIPTHFTQLLDPMTHGSFLKKEDTIINPFPSWLLQTQNQNQNQSQDHQQNQQCSPSTNTSTSGPTLLAYHPSSAAAYMSATALLQKAAQIGATHLSRNGASIHAPCTTTTLPTYQQQYMSPHVSSNNNNNNICGTSVLTSTPCASGPTTTYYQQQPPMSMSMMMMMSSQEDGFVVGDDMSSFEDEFSQILESNKDNVDDHDHGHANVNAKIKNEGMTRDFLGLKPVSNGMHGN